MFLFQLRLYIEEPDKITPSHTKATHIRHKYTLHILDITDNDITHVLLKKVYYLIMTCSVTVLYF